MLLRGGGAALLAGRPRVRPGPDRAMGAAPVLVLLLIAAAAALPRRARAVTDAGDGNAPCSARLLVSLPLLCLIVTCLAVGSRHQLPARAARLLRRASLECLFGWVLLFAR